MLTEIRDLLKEISTQTGTDDKVLIDKAIEHFQLGEEKEETIEEQNLETWRCTCGTVNAGHSAYCSKCNTVRKFSLTGNEEY